MDLAAAVCDGLNTPYMPQGKNRDGAKGALQALSMTREHVREAERRTYVQMLQHDTEHLWYVEIENASHRMPDAVAFFRRGHGENERLVLIGIWINGYGISPRKPRIVTETWLPDMSSCDVDVLQMQENEDGHSIDDTRQLDLYDQVLKVGLHVIGAAMAEWGSRRTHRIVDAAYWERTGRAANNRREPSRWLWREIERTPIVRTTPFGGFDTGRRPITPAKSALECVIAAARRTTRHERHNYPLARIFGTDWIDETEHGACLWQLKNAILDEDEPYTAQGRNLDQFLKCETMPPTQALCELLERTLQASGRPPADGTPTHEPLQALLVPRKIWEDIAKAGEPPELPDPFEHAGRRLAWYVEIEKPAPGEPRGIALWRNDEDDTRTTIGIWTSGHDASPHAPIVAMWCQGKNIANTSMGVIRLADPIERAMTGEEFDTLAQQLLWMLVGEKDWLGLRAVAAAAEHLTRREAREVSGAPPPPMIWNEPAAPGERNQHKASAPEGLFAIERMSEGARLNATPTGKTTGQRSKGPLLERQEVEAHWKRQAYGLRREKRKVILVESYKRGPRAGPEQIVMDRMAPRPE